jgi:hypothetical protein
MNWLVRILASGLLALIACGVSNNLYWRVQTRAEQVDNQFAILERRPLHFDHNPTAMNMWRNRILFPLALKAVDAMQVVPLRQAYVLVRFLTAWAALLIFWLLIERTCAAPVAVCLAGTSVLAHGLIITFLSYTRDVPSDFLDVGFTAAYVWCCLKGRRALLVGLILFGATNRESAAFAGIIWFGLRGIREGRLQWNESIFGGAMCCLGYGAALMLRQAFALADPAYSGPQQDFALLSVVEHSRKFLGTLSLNGWPLLGMAMLGLPVIVILQHRARLGATGAGLLAAAGMITFVTMIFGIISELRVFIPTLVVLVYVAAVISHAPCPWASPGPGVKS